MLTVYVMLSRANFTAITVIYELKIVSVINLNFWTALRMRYMKAVVRPSALCIVSLKITIDWENTRANTQQADHNKLARIRTVTIYNPFFGGVFRYVQKFADSRCFCFIEHSF